MIPLWIGLGACSAATSADWRCDDNVEIALDELLVSNNVWNKGAVRDYEQCIAARPGPIRWKWRWPGGDLMPEAYPEIVFGHHPWRDASTTPRLPVRVREVDELTVDYSVSVDGDGIFNLAFQLWLVDRLPPTPEAARAELMVWVVNRGMTPAGEWTGELAAGSARFDVFESDREHLDRGVPRRWRLVTLVATEPRPVGALRLGDLLRTLTAQGRLKPEHWIANLDLGTEIVAGSGRAEIRRYDVEVR